MSARTSSRSLLGRDSFGGSLPSGPRASRLQQKASAASVDAASVADAKPQRENISVAIRIRPLSDAESRRGDAAVWVADGAGQQTLRCTVTPPAAATATPHATAQLPTSWNFDRVFGPDADSHELYNKMVKGMVTSAMAGLNATVFAYGQTGSGKTHTMRALTQAAAADIFDSIASAPNTEFYLRVSAIEIYNEEVRDMLCEDGPPLKMVHDPKRGGTCISGLREEGVHSAQHLLQLLKEVEFRRRVRETNMNECSSRSHQIFRVHIESRPVAGGGGAGGGAAAAAARPVRVSVLDLVDLAGAEQVGRDLDAQSDRTRKAEGIYINSSLHVLGKVIRALGDEESHVPYRESKLTRLLQNSLEGNSRTALVCTLSPSSRHQDESRLAVHFATAAKRVTLQPTVNEVVSDKALLRQLQAQIDTLRQQLAGSSIVQQNAQLTARLRETEEQTKKVAEQKEQAEKKLRGLERLILRSDSNSVKQRASWSCSPARSESSSMCTPPPITMAGGGRREASVSASWNPGQAGRKGQSLKNDRLLLDWLPRGKAASGGAAGVGNASTASGLGGGGDLIRSVGGPSSRANSGNLGSNGASSRAAATTAGRIDAMAGPTGDAAAKALDALRAEVACMDVKSVGGGGLGGPGGVGDGRSNSPTSTIARLQDDLARMEQERVIGEFLDTQKEQLIGAMQQELQRLKEAQQVDVAAQRALNSLEKKLNSINLSSDGSVLLGDCDDDDGVISDDADDDTARWQCSPEMRGSLTAAAVAAAGGGGGAARTPAQLALSSVRYGDEDDGCDVDSSSPNMDSPVCGLSSVGGKENSFSSRGGRSSSANSMLPGPGAPTRMASAPTPLSPRNEPGGSSGSDLAGRAATGHRVNRSISDRGPAGRNGTPPGRSHAEVLEWYKAKLRTVKESYRQVAERDLGNLRAALDQYKMQVQRLDCQKQLLLKQVLRLELRQEEQDKQHQAKVADLARQLMAATKQAAEASRPGMLDINGLAAGGAAGPSASGQPSAQPPMPRSPMQSPLPGGPGSEYLGDWASAPSVETLMPKIVALWDQLHVPLKHRSKFYTAFRGRELFYYEAEHRRLSHLRGQLVAEDGSSPKSSRAAKKKLDVADRRLDWERKWLMSQLKAEFTDEEREELYLQWNIHYKSQDRKKQLISKLWSPQVTVDDDGMQLSSELVLLLNDADASDGMFDLVFGKTEGDGWWRSVANTGGALVAPIVQRLRGSPSRQSLQRLTSGGGPGGLRRSSVTGTTGTAAGVGHSRRHSITSFMGWDRGSNAGDAPGTPRNV